MIFRFPIPLAVAGLGLLFIVERIPAADLPKASREQQYKEQILPILQARCYECHAGSEQESGFRLDTRHRALVGGDSGVAIIPGNPGESEFLRRITSTDESEWMPPEGERLSSSEIALLTDWIAEGASGLPDSIAEQPTHWAFQPISRPTPPPVDSTWPHNAVDSFILDRLRQETIEPSATASRETLVRRLYLDLLGLLPPRERVTTFIRAGDPDAFERLVDELLASPHYGERWGRHWLDLARYADSTGYESDQPRQIWAYRDWVINALNRDLPFSDFVIEQFAGDQIPNATVSQKIATGFHCNAMFDGGVRWEAVIDRVNTTGSIFLGLTLGCAQCHTHKTDPVTQREFYSLFAYFNAGYVRQMDFAGNLVDPPPSPVDKTTELPATTLIMTYSPSTTHLFVRGDPRNHGEQVTSGVPAFLHDLETRDDQPSQRLDLARWIMADDNPLTARVTTNRVWQRFFGLGLVKTENDFGVQTPLPIHSSLLDFLSIYLRGKPTHPIHQWSTKHLHRLIVSSATYRQSSHIRRDLLESDPQNHWWARQNRLRLEAEIIRDIALDAADLLTPKIGGASVYPAQPDGILAGRATPAQWEPSTGEDRLRRGMYTWVWRLTPHPHLPLFDAPDGVTACTRRDRSNVPVQALTLLNDPTFVECSQALGRRVIRTDSASDSDAIQFLFQTCLSRLPSQQEHKLIEQLLNQQRQTLALSESECQLIVGESSLPHVSLTEQAAWVVIARSIQNLDEFFTRP